MNKNTIIICAVVIIVAAGVYFLGTRQSFNKDIIAVSNHPISVTSNDVKNATYTTSDFITDTGTVQVNLDQGHYQGHSAIGIVNLATTSIFYGDFNNDGATDATAVLDINENGNMVKNLYVISGAGGSIQSYFCSEVHTDTSELSFRNGVIVDTNPNDEYDAYNNGLHTSYTAYKFDGTKCSVGGVDIANGEQYF